MLLAAAAVAATPPANSQIQSSLDKLNSVQLPPWRIHFGLVSFPRLNELQKAKLKVQNLQMEIVEHEREILRKQAEIDKITRGSVERRSRSYFLLGLFGRKTLVRDHEVIYDEKSILWGTFKWGKRMGG